MLRALLICSDDQLNQQLTLAALKVPDLTVVRALTAYPTTGELLRIVRVRQADLLLLCVDDLVESEKLAKCIDDTMPGFPIITIGSREVPEVLHKLMHLGIREHLTSPVRDAGLAEAVEAVRVRLASHPPTALKPADVYTFLPAKPGVGTSTIAISTSCALADELGVRTLLLDADLAAGAIQFLLKLGPTTSVVDALTHAESLDEDMWSQLVGKWDKLDVLHAGELNSPPGINYPGLEHVLSVARAQYEVICADLGSCFDPLSLALLQDSRKIFLVTTSEIAPLHLARVRMRRLTALGLDDPVSLLLNRKVRNEVTDADVEKAVGIPVTYSFSNDYRTVQGSILQASPVAQSSKLGENILSLAHSLVLHRDAKPASSHHKFLEFFHIQSAHDTDLTYRN